MSQPSSDRPTCKMTSEELLGLVRHEKSQPIRFAAASQPVRLVPADDVAQITAPLPVAPPAPYVMSALPPPALYLAPRLPPATSAMRTSTELVALADRPGPLGAVIGFALVALAFAVGAYIVVV